MAPRPATLVVNRQKTPTTTNLTPAASSAEKRQAGPAPATLPPANRPRRPCRSPSASPPSQRAPVALDAPTSRRGNFDDKAVPYRHIWGRSEYLIWWDLS